MGKKASLQSLTLHQLLKQIAQTDLFKLLSLIIPPLLAILLLFRSLRELMAPFIFAGVAAYILYPLVNFVKKRLHLPAPVAVVIIFSIFFLLIISLLGRIIVIGNGEIRDFLNETRTTTTYIASLPDWLRPIVYDGFRSIQDLFRINNSFALPFVENALLRFTSMIAFLIATFYFLKDAPYITEFLKKHFLYKEVNNVLQNYLRGQIYLIIIMSVLSWIFLTVIQVPFSLLISLFTGFAEIFPFVGPILATVLALAIVLLANVTAFGNSVIATLVIVAIGYFLLRQLEDFFVIPYVLSRSIRLHPLLILTVIFIGGRLYGVMGLLFGIPAVAIYKIILETFLRKKA